MLTNIFGRHVEQVQCVRLTSTMRGSSRVIRMTELNLITVQQDAIYSVYYISVGSSTCFGC